MDGNIIGLIISILLLIISIIGLVLKNNIIFFSCLYLCILLFLYSVGDLYKDNYSIEEIIEMFKLRDGDILTYKYNIKQGNKRCRVGGKYDNNYLQVDEIKSPKDRRHDLCPDVKKYTELKFIGNKWSKDDPLGKRKIELNIYK